MIKEYCDRCRREFDPDERRSKKVVKITIPSSQSWMDTQEQLHCVQNVLAEWKSRVQ